MPRLVFRHERPSARTMLPQDELFLIVVAVLARRSIGTNARSVERVWEAFREIERIGGATTSLSRESLIEEML